MDVRAAWLVATRWLRLAWMATGGIAAAMLILAFTSIPFHAHRWLGTAGGLCTGTPAAIVVLSGSGMPSGPELMRCQTAASLAATAPGAEVLLLLPNDTALARAMVDELALRGVQPGRIRAILHGRSTREQALDLARALPPWKDRALAVVTVPEHMYRTLLTFRKLGFTAAEGAPAFDHALYDDLQYDHRQLGGKPYIPDVSGSMGLRYDFWNYLKLEITCLREYAALAYYKLNGWI